MKRVICLVLLVFIVMVESFSVFADSDTVSSGTSSNENDKEIEYGEVENVSWLFLQGDSRWGQYVYGGGATIGYSGCMITGIAILEAYDDESLRDAETFNPAVCASDYMHFAGAGAYWDLLKGDLENADAEVGHTSIHTIADLKKLMDEGYYILAWGPVYSGTHYSPIVGWDEEEGHPIIYDVAAGWSGPGWNEFTLNGSSINPGSGGNWFHFYKGSVPSYEAFKAVAGEGVERDIDAEIKAFEVVKNQWELKGMPSKSMLTADINYFTQLPDDGNLSLNMLQSLRAIKEGRGNQLTVLGVFRMICSFIGILVVIYSILLWLSAVFDMQNNILDLSLVSVLTLGKVRLVDSGEQVTSELAKEGYVTHKTLYIRCAVLLACGCVLISGVVFDTVYLLYEGIKKLM